MNLHVRGRPGNSKNLGNQKLRLCRPSGANMMQNIHTFMQRIFTAQPLMLRRSFLLGAALGPTAAIALAGSGAAAGPVRVAAASDLKFALVETGPAITKDPQSSDRPSGRCSSASDSSGHSRSRFGTASRSTSSCRPTRSSCSSSRRPDSRRSGRLVCAGAYRGPRSCGSPSELDAWLRGVLLPTRTG